MSRKLMGTGIKDKLIIQRACHPASPIEELYGSRAYFSRQICEDLQLLFYFLSLYVQSYIQMTLSDGRTRKLARVSLFRGS